jgi:hypothetical protein
MSRKAPTRRLYFLCLLLSGLAFNELVASPNVCGTEPSQKETKRRGSTEGRKEDLNRRQQRKQRGDVARNGQSGTLRLRWPAQR